MKILLVNDFRESVGGTEIYVNGITEELIKRNHVVKLFTGDTLFKDYPKNKSFLKLLNLLFSIKYAIKFRTVIKNFKPDIIHINNIFYELSPSFLLLTGDIPVIMTVHDSQLYSPLSIQSLRTGKNCKKEICEGCSNCMGFTKSRFEIFKRKFHRILLKNIDLYIGNSNYTNAIINKLKFGKTVHIQHGINLFNQTNITNKYTLMYVGRLVLEKGVQYIIDAMPTIVQNFPQTKLVIVGDGEYKRNLQELIKKYNLEKNIEFRSSVDHVKIEQYYKDSTIVLVPSIWNEPFGLVGIEAMSVGRPVIASRIGGIPEWLKNNESGYLVDPGNSQQIADRVLRLFTNKELLQSMSKKSRIIAEEFSMTKHVNQLEKVYADLISKYKNRSRTKE